MTKTVTASFQHQKCGGMLIPIATNGSYQLEASTGRIVFKHGFNEAVFKCNRCERKGEIVNVSGEYTRTKLPN